MTKGCSRNAGGGLSCADQRASLKEYDGFASRDTSIKGTILYGEKARGHYANPRSVAKVPGPSPRSVVKSPVNGIDFSLRFAPKAAFFKR
jgi:hypothetical protein